MVNKTYPNNLHSCTLFVRFISLKIRNTVSRDLFNFFLLRLPEMWLKAYNRGCDANLDYGYRMLLRFSLKF